MKVERNWKRIRILLLLCVAAITAICAYIITQWVISVFGLDLRSAPGTPDFYRVVLVICSLLLLLLLLFYLVSRVTSLFSAYHKAMYKHKSLLEATLQENKDLQKNMRDASSRAIQLNEQFLRKIGADLHDGPAQSIGYAVISLDKVNKDDSNSDVFNQQYHSVKDALTYSIEEIRTIAAGLVLPQIENLSLPDSVVKVISLHQKKSDMKVDHLFQRVPDEVPMPIKICVYRLVQESLNNAERHGEAKSCRVTMKKQETDLIIKIKDNGKGFSAEPADTGHDHLGIFGLRDRIESLGGSFKINSQAAVGSTIIATIPMV